MSFFDQQPYRREVKDERVKIWNKQKVHTHDDASYNQRAREGQNVAASSSTVNARSGKQNVAQAPNERQGSSDPRKQLDQPSQEGIRYTSYGQPRRMTVMTDAQRYATPTGPTNFAQNAPPGLETQPPAYFVKSGLEDQPPAYPEKGGLANQPPPARSAKSTNQSPVAIKDQKKLPPHLRHSGSTPSTPTQASVAPPNKSSKKGSRNDPTLNAGPAAKPAKWASRFPCTYDDCDRGFTEEKALRRHKAADHFYCRLCDEDCEDFDDLLYHKLESLEHICCCVCGQDFSTDPGRDRHEKQVHPTMTECKCIGCGYVFERGAALIHHIQENRCRDRSGCLPKLVNQETLSAGRIQAALHLDALSHLNTPSMTTKMIEDMQPKDDDNSSAGGGVILPPKSQHLLDSQEPMEGSEAVAEKEQSTDDLIDLMDRSASLNGNIDSNFPTLGQAALMKSKKQESTIEGLSEVSMNDPPSPKWGLGFSSDAASTTTGRGTGATMLDYRQVVLGEGSERRVVATDWDSRVFRRHEVDGLYHCPFARCTSSFQDSDFLKSHLTSGIHQGTNHRCLKCLKLFKTAAALIAHMESNSIKCSIKNTEHFGQILTVVSGGFLGVRGLNADGSVKIGALDEEELAEQDREQRALLPYENPEYNWNL